MNSEAREREAFAAGMKKAAEICEKEAEQNRAAHEAPIGSISRGSPYHEGAADAADECVFKILAAIPSGDAIAALSEAQPEVTAGKFAVVIESHGVERTAYVDDLEFGKQICDAMVDSQSAIEAAVREKLEEAANLLAKRWDGEVYTDEQACYQTEAESCAGIIRALIKSPQPSVEEPAN